MSEQDKPRHDGKLGGSGYETATIEYYNAQYRPEGTAIYISGGYGDIESSSITLDTKQALSLLAWLRQEESALETLAKEQTNQSENAQKHGIIPDEEERTTLTVEVEHAGKRYKGVIKEIS